AEDGIRDFHVTGVQTCALPISAMSIPTDGDQSPACGTFPDRAPARLHRGPQSPRLFRFQILPDTRIIRGATRGRITGVDSVHRRTRTRARVDPEPTRFTHADAFATRIGRNRRSRWHAPRVPTADRAGTPVRLPRGIDRSTADGRRLAAALLRPGEGSDTSGTAGVSFCTAARPTGPERSAIRR